MFESIRINLIVILLSETKLKVYISKEVLMPYRINKSSVMNSLDMIIKSYSEKDYKNNYSI